MNLFTAPYTSQYECFGQNKEQTGHLAVVGGVKITGSLNPKSVGHSDQHHQHPHTFTCCLLSLSVFTSSEEEKSFHWECLFLVGVAVSALFTSCFTAVFSVGEAVRGVGLVFIAVDCSHFVWTITTWWVKCCQVFWAKRVSELCKPFSFLKCPPKSTLSALNFGFLERIGFFSYSLQHTWWVLEQHLDAIRGKLTSCATLCFYCGGCSVNFNFAQEMNPTEFGDFSSCTIMRLIIVIWSEIS